MKKITRKKQLGIDTANVIMENAHMMYNAQTATGYVQAVIDQLQSRIGELVPKKATKKYKEARYGKKEKK